MHGHKGNEMGIKNCISGIKLVDICAVIKGPKYKENFYASLERVDCPLKCSNQLECSKPILCTN